LKKEPKNGNHKWFILVFNLSFMMFLWAFVATIVTDPGRVPLYWGFYLDAPDTRKRRYCLVCHIFKPERCHHCSTCNRCVLNMDHHCPWINNCVGFSNRKYFILLLFYVLVTVILGICGFIPKVLSIGKQSKVNFRSVLNTDCGLILLSFVSLCAVFVALVVFFKFHLWLVVNNLTTIENMNHEKSGYNPMYNMGFYYNWIQVFGKN